MRQKQIDACLDEMRQSIKRLEMTQRHKRIENLLIITNFMLEHDKLTMRTLCDGIKFYFHVRGTMKTLRSHHAVTCTREKLYGKTLMYWSINRKFAMQFIRMLIAELQHIREYTYKHGHAETEKAEL